MASSGQNNGPQSPRIARIMEAIEKLTTQMGQLQNTTEREMERLWRSNTKVSDKLDGLERRRRRLQPTSESSNGSGDDRGDVPPRYHRNRQTNRWPRRREAELKKPKLPTFVGNRDPELYSNGR
ncbi:hypothetical protein Fmac_026718 [Flemingia macrophylla]|uniref:Uncharacterized protein n=1 Tax=Flemingia macrophylla TaxID=520843 RepID=A0ABD1LFN2_9FABA